LRLFFIFLKKSIKMNFYWVYDIPNWLFFVITSSFFISFSLLGAFLFSNYFEKKIGLSVETNSIVSIFLGLSGVFYGITLGLIAVGTFDNFNSTETIINNESSALGALFSDVSILQSPEKEKLKQTLRDYTHYEVEVAWPMQKNGKIPNGGTEIIQKFEKQLALYEPINAKDQVIYSKLFNQYNGLVEKRRLLLNAINGGLPSTIWLVLLLGACINIVLTWLLVINNKKLDIMVNSLMGLLLASLIFLIAAMDNPFRGEYSVTSDSFQLLLDGIMKN
jgi:Protein of unknown function (DUF4239)